MGEHTRVNPNSFEEYLNSALIIIESKISRYYKNLKNASINRIESDELSINEYSHLSSLKEIKNDQIFILDEQKIDTTYAEETVLNGDFFWEHAAAGEATRLGMGTKYVIDLSGFTLEKLKNMIIEELEKDLIKSGDNEKDKKIMEAREKFSEENLYKLMGVNPVNLMPISLGTRHMLQMVFDVRRIALKNNKDPDAAVKKQKTLIILNESTGKEIVSEFISYNFFGLDPMNVYFMVQKSFHGISIEAGKLFYFESDNKRLNNHGQMMMQKAIENSIFRVMDGKKIHLEKGQFESVLSKCKDLLSYNIEDIGYLTDAVDCPSLAFALNLGKKGYDMVMEIVAQNPYKPQKGGAAFFDPILKKNVMIETNLLNGMKNEDIKHLNKNFNHYPNPVNSFRRMKKYGLELPFEVKKAKDGKKYIYPCPVQGNLNFIVKTAFVMRKEVKPISNWKSAATTPPAIKAFFEQENQAGFKEFADSIIKK